MSTKQAMAICPRRRAAGQALIELLIALLVLLPAIVLIPLFGKYQAIQWATIAASRDLAFECTVRLAQCQLANAGELGQSELQGRMFTAADAPIQARPFGSGQSFSNVGPPLWVDGRGVAMLSGAGAVVGSLTRPSLDAGRAVALTVHGSAGRAQQQQILEHAGPAQFGWQMTDGLLVARVRSQIGDGLPEQAHPATTASLRALQAPQAPLRLRFSASTAIVADAWNASGSDLDDGNSVATRVARGSALEPVIEQQLASAYAPMIRFANVVRDAGLERYAPTAQTKTIDPDLVPADRLQSPQ